MGFLRIRNVAVVALLGLFAVGCSSTPTSDDAETVSTRTVTEASLGTVATSKPLKADTLTQDNEATVAPLFASLQGKRVHFELDRAEIKPEYMDVLRKHAQYLELNPNARLTIEGHCDERGTREYNLALGERRGNAVKDALVAQGVNPNRLNVISFGKDMPLVDLSNEQAWQKNRRAEFAY